MTYEPNHPDSPRYTTTWHEGMDLRDYFAAKAMQGMLSNSAFDTIEEMMRTSIVAYMMADAMMKARNETA